MLGPEQYGIFGAYADTNNWEKENSDIWFISADFVY